MMWRRAEEKVGEIKTNSTNNIEAREAKEREEAEERYA